MNRASIFLIITKLSFPNFYRNYISVPNNKLTLYEANSFFVVFQDITQDVGSLSLPTHRRDAHRKFF